MESAGDLFDLSILYTEDTIQWCEYLFDVFKDFEIQQNSENITEFPFDQPSSLCNIQNSLLSVVIISPMFLQKCTPRMQDYLHHVVGLLCGVDSSDMDELFEKIPSAKDWNQVDATAGCNQITQVVLKVLHQASDEKERQKVHVPTALDETYLTMGAGDNQQVQSDYMVMTSGKSADDVPTENTYFNQGAPPEEEYESMTALTQAPKQYAPPEGHVFHSIGYVDMKGAKHMPQCSQGLSIQPEKARSGDVGSVIVFFQDPLISMNVLDQYFVIFQGKCKQSEVIAKQMNPYALKLELPKEHPAELTDAHVLSPTRSLMGTFKFLFTSVMDDLADVLLNITSPMQFMCQALGISPADANELDNVLYEHIQRCIPPGGLNLMVGQTGVEQKVILEMPTALHFAAKYGLKNICSMLINCPGAVQAMKMKNSHGFTPDILAGKNGHNDLKSFLETFVDVAEDEGIQSEGSTTSSYLIMKSGLAAYYKNEDFLKQIREQNRDYDLPFKVAIPAVGFTEDETIKKLVQGQPEDIDDYYDSLTIDMGSFERDQDAEADYEEVLDEFGNRQRPAKRTISRRPPMKHPSEEITVIPESTMLSVEPAEAETVVEKPPPPVKGIGTLVLPGIDAEQQALIDLQNSVKSNDITVDEAVMLFKNLELLQETKRMSFMTQSANLTALKKQKQQRKDNKSGGFRGLLGKKQPKKGPQPTVSTYSRPQERVQPAEFMTVKNRPTSTTSSASSDSRGSILSTSDRDSSYCSAADESEQERSLPMLRRQEKIPPNMSQQDRIKRLSLIHDFSPEYIQKPVPAIPGRPTPSIPQSLQDLPKPSPPKPSTPKPSTPKASTPKPSSPYSQFSASSTSTDEQPMYLEFDQSPDEVPADFPALPPPPIPNNEEVLPQGLERKQSDPQSPLSPAHPLGLLEIQASKSRLKHDNVRKPIPRPRAAPRN